MLVSDFSSLGPCSIASMRNRHGAETLSPDALLTILSQCEQTDKRDRVFGLFIITSEGSGDQLAPDYSLSSCEVYYRAIRSIDKRLMIPTALRK